MYNSTLRTFTGRMIIATLGCIIMSIGINVFTTPWNFYTTGLVGYSQFLRSVLVEDYGITLSNIDLAGVIYYALSIPIFIITFKGLGRSFFLRTLVFTAVFSLTTAFIPVPSAPVINDRLTCVLIGSVCVGVGDGMVITCGCTGGPTAPRTDFSSGRKAFTTPPQSQKDWPSGGQVYHTGEHTALCDVLLPL